MNSRYENLALPTAWRAFELSRGGRLRELERRLRGLEDRVGDLNLERETVHLAAELAGLEPALDEDTRFALIVLIVITIAALAQGSTRFPVHGELVREPMRAMLVALLGSNEGEGDRIRDAIDGLLLNNLAPKVIGRARTERRPLLFLDPFITHERSRALEQRLVDGIVSLQGGAGSFDATRIQRAIDDVVKRPAIVGSRQLEFSAEQLRAIKVAAGSRLALVSGGPGTGKTSIVIAVLRVLVRLGVSPAEIALSAPTGRAAFRMRESAMTSLAHIAEPSPEDEMLRAAALDAATIHRLLGYSPARATFLHHRNNPLAARVVIVDEGSMLDLALMERLVGALDRDARLVILGDSDQLPSVAAGAAFRDLLPPDRAHPLAASSARLTRNYRARKSDPGGAAIVEMSRRINAGDTDLADGGELLARRESAADIQFRGVELLPAPGVTEEFLERWDREQATGDGAIAAAAEREYALAGGSFAEEERARLARLFEHRTATRILCVTRVGAGGADSINARMHRRALQRSPGATRAQSFLAGEPVIVVRNDYERGLFNGDQGMVVSARDSEGRRFLLAVFNRGREFTPFRLDAMRDLIELSYATTIHKAQGSEFEAAAIILPDRDLPLLSRELLYTAVSRCRRAAIIVGAPQLLAAGIARKTERFSGLADELKARVVPEGPRQLGLFQ